ncbi:hypothetical protein B0H14DRAFT_2623104 [Mycena olivaceomarginata]|nr:hypothetical protein B0H14DRAFT_2623104 [Mycena olivaceomarginata]
MPSITLRRCTGNVKSSKTLYGTTVDEAQRASHLAAHSLGVTFFPGKPDYRGNIYYEKSDGAPFMVNFKKKPLRPTNLYAPLRRLRRELLRQRLQSGNLHENGGAVPAQRFDVLGFADFGCSSARLQVPHASSTGTRTFFMIGGLQDPGLSGQIPDPNPDKFGENLVFCLCQIPTFFTKIAQAWGKSRQNRAGGRKFSKFSLWEAKIWVWTVISSDFGSLACSNPDKIAQNLRFGSRQIHLLWEQAFGANWWDKPGSWVSMAGATSESSDARVSDFDTVIP